MVAVASAGASPGASALAVSLGMARSRTGADGVVLVEADPAGGRIGPRFGLRADPSLATYVSDARRGSTPALVLRNVQRIGSLAVLVSPVDPELTRQVLTRGGEDLARLLHEGPLDAIVDLGRFDDGSAALPFATYADQVLLVTRPRYDEVQALLFRQRLLLEGGCTVGLVTIGDEPHPPHEVAAVVDLPLMAALPDDAVAASAFCGGRFKENRLVRTRLWKSVLTLSDRLWSGPAMPGPAASPASRQLDDGADAPGDDAPGADVADPDAPHPGEPDREALDPSTAGVGAPRVGTTAAVGRTPEEPNRRVGVARQPPRRRSRPLSARSRDRQPSERDV